MSCYELLGKGSNGKVEKFCDDAGCKKCYVKKTGNVNRIEADIMKEVKKVTNGTPYEKHVMRLKKMEDHGDPDKIIIISDYVENYGSLRHFLFHRKEIIPRVEWIHFIAKLFLTLDYLHNTLKFVHMDLKTANILVLKNGPESSFPSPENYEDQVIDFPETLINPQLIDFGLSNMYVERYGDEEELDASNGVFDGPPFNRNCIRIIFDIFEFILDTLEVLKDSEQIHLRPIILDMVHFLFKTPTKSGAEVFNILDNEKYSSSNFHMLISKGCDFTKENFPNIKYSDVLQVPSIKASLHGLHFV